MDLNEFNKAIDELPDEPVERLRGLKSLVEEMFEGPQRRVLLGLMAETATSTYTATDSAWRVAMSNPYNPNPGNGLSEAIRYLHEKAGLDEK